MINICTIYIPGDEFAIIMTNLYCMPLPLHACKRDPYQSLLAYRLLALGTAPESAQSGDGHLHHRCSKQVDGTRRQEGSGRWMPSGNSYTVEANLGLQKLTLIANSDLPQSPFPD